MVELTAPQRSTLRMYGLRGADVLIQSRSVNGCTIIVHNPDSPDIIYRMFVAADGKVKAKFRYRLVHDPVATAA